MKPLRLALACLSLLLAGPVIACESEAFTALKQLAGSWQVSEDGVAVGRLDFRVGPGGCAMIEEWHAADGGSASGLHWPEQVENEDGEPATVLHQVYVEDSGWFIRADGSYTDGVLVYEGEAAINEQELVLRATLHGLGGDEVVHINDASDDGGASWRRISTYRYTRRAD